MEQIGPWVALGAVVGMALGFLQRAQRHLRPSQSKLRWIPAMIVGRQFRRLGEVLAFVALGAVVGGLLGATAWTSIDAIAR